MSLSGKEKYFDFEMERVKFQNFQELLEKHQQNQNF